MVTLIPNKNPSTIKVKETVSKDPPTVKEVVDLRDDEGSKKTIPGKDWELGEDVFDGGPVGKVNIPQGGVEGWGSEAGVGTSEKGREAEETCLEKVSGGNVGSVV